MSAPWLLHEITYSRRPGHRRKHRWFCSCGQGASERTSAEAQRKVALHLWSTNHEYEPFGADDMRRALGTYPCMDGHVITPYGVCWDCGKQVAIRVRVFRSGHDAPWVAEIITNPSVQQSDDFDPWLGHWSTWGEAMDFAWRFQAVLARQTQREAS